MASSSLNCGVSGPKSGQMEIARCAWLLWTLAIIVSPRSYSGLSKRIEFQFSFSPQYCQSWTMQSSGMPISRCVRSASHSSSVL